MSTVPDQHRHYSCRPHDELHLAIEHFNWPLHGPGMLCQRLSELLNRVVRQIKTLLFRASFSDDRTWLWQLLLLLWLHTCDNVNIPERTSLVSSHPKTEGRLHHRPVISTCYSQLPHSADSRSSPVQAVILTSHTIQVFLLPTILVLFLLDLCLFPYRMRAFISHVQGQLTSFNGWQKLRCKSSFFPIAIHYNIQD